MQFLDSDSISTCSFSPRKCLMDRRGLLLWFSSKYSTQISAFCFFVYLIFLSYLFVSLLSYTSFVSYTIKTFSTHSLPPVSPQIIHFLVFIDVHIVCAIQGLSCTLNLIQAVMSMAEILLVVLTERQEA